jgi:fructoselysine-6-P-deglycase FrlB-like protein
MEAVGESLGCIIFGGEREARLARDVESFGARVAFITDGAPDGGLSAPALTLAGTGPLALPVLQILPAQLLVDHVARRRGMPIGELLRHQDDTKVT